MIRSWPVHNILAHPLSEVLWWLGLRRWSVWIHDVTLPDGALPR